LEEVKVEDFSSVALRLSPDRLVLAVEEETLESAFKLENCCCKGEGASGACGGGGGVEMRRWTT